MVRCWHWRTKEPCLVHGVLGQGSRCRIEAWLAELVMGQQLSWKDRWVNGMILIDHTLQPLNNTDLEKEKKVSCYLTIQAIGIWLLWLEFFLINSPGKWSYSPQFSWRFDRFKALGTIYLRYVLFPIFSESAGKDDSNLQGGKSWLKKACCLSQLWLLCCLYRLKSTFL